MTVSFESIVKSENRLPEDPKIIRVFSLVPKISDMDRQARGNKDNFINQRNNKCEDGQSDFAINDKKIGQ